MDCTYSVSFRSTGADILNSYVPGDQAGLISLYGGAENFVKRLNYMHDNDITYIGNEVNNLQCHLIDRKTELDAACVPHGVPIPLCGSSRPVRPALTFLHPSVL
jgi:hypothetical protein